MKKTIKPLLFCLVFIGLINVSQAQQKIPADTDHPVLVKGSLKELNMITVENGRVSRVDGPTHVEFDKDQANGSLFMVFKTNRIANVFVTTNKGHTVPLIISPEDIPLQKIVIQEKGVASVDSEEDFASIPLENKVVSLLKLMADDEANKDAYDIKKNNEDQTEWRDTRLTLIESWNYQGMVGEVLEFSNTGKMPVRVSEEEFYKSGYLAVSVERLSLSGGNSTKVYRIKEDRE